MREIGIGVVGVFIEGEIAATLFGDVEVGIVGEKDFVEDARLAGGGELAE
jgi:hypothetical protein